MKRLVLGLSFVIVHARGDGERGWRRRKRRTAGPRRPGIARSEPPRPPQADGHRLPPRAVGPSDRTRRQPGEAAQRSWQDVVVVPRKAFLKGGRLELFPFTGVSLNDVLIRHYSFGGELNYYLTDVFSVGLEGQYYIKERTDRESMVGLQYNRIATLNRYLYSGSLNFGYVPGYGKFTLFNRYIIHWDLYVQGGVGLIQTEIIPRVVGDATFKNNRIAPNVGVGHPPVPEQLADLQRRGEGLRLQRPVRADRPHAHARPSPRSRPAPSRSSSTTSCCTRASGCTCRRRSSTGRLADEAPTMHDQDGVTTLIPFRSRWRPWPPCRWLWPARPGPSCPNARARWPMRRRSATAHELRSLRFEIGPARVDHDGAGLLSRGHGGRESQLLPGRLAGDRRHAAHNLTPGSRPPSTSGSRRCCRQASAMDRAPTQARGPARA